MSGNIISRGQVLCAVALETRMYGSRLSVMSTAGSGNHGIKEFFTIFVVEEKRNLSREKMIKSLVLSNLITFFIKACTAEIGASCDVVYLLAGKKQILDVLYNMVGSISGMICDGAKDRCA